MNNSGFPLASTRLPHLSLLLAFQTVAELGNFTRAATFLHLSQSAVSQQVVKLEEALGTQLFVRSTRTVELTRAGKQLLVEIRGPMEQLAWALDRCGRNDEPPTLHIEVEPVISAVWLTPRLKLFTQQFPELRIQQLLSTLRLEFPAQVELAIKWGYGNWQGFDSERLLGVHYVPVCSPALLEGPNAIRDPADLARHSLLHDRSMEDWSNWQKLYPHIQLKLSGGHMVTDWNVLAQMAIEGYGVALYAAEFLERPLRNGDLVVPFPEMVMPHEQAYYLLTRPQASISEFAELFITWLKKMLSCHSV